MRGEGLKVANRIKNLVSTVFSATISVGERLFEEENILATERCLIKVKVFSQKGDLVSVFVDGRSI